MQRLSGKYGTRHPKDVAARRMQALQQSTRDNGCTRNELDKPTEHNVQKCMHEMRKTDKSGEQYKSDAKFLGENSNIDKHRRR